MLTKYRIEIKYSVITLLMLAALVILNKIQAFSGLNKAISDFFDFMTNLGVVGVFIVSIIGTASLLIIIPYTVPMLSLALRGASLETMLVMGVVSGIGSGLGEFISYGLAERILGENPNLEKSRLFQWVKRTVDSHPRATPILVFVWAGSVLPDDTVIIPLAMMRYGIRRLALPLFAGKLVHNLIIACVFYYFTEWSADRVSTQVQADLALGILILFILMILYQVEKTRANNKAKADLLSAEVDFTPL